MLADEGEKSHESNVSKDANGDVVVTDLSYEISSYGPFKEELPILVIYF